MYGSTEISSGSSREDLPVITQQASPSQQQEQSHELGNGSLREPAGTDAFPGEDLEDRDPGPRETDPDKGESLPAASAPSAPLPDGRMREGQLDNDLGTNNGLVASGTPAPVSSSTFEPVACSTFPHFSSSAPLPIASSAAPTSATKAASLFPIGPQTPAGPSAQFPGAAAGPTVPAARSAAALFPVDALGPSQGTASSSMDWIPSKVPPPASTLVGASGVGNARSFPGFPLPSAERPAGVSTSNPASGTGGTGGAADRPPGRDSGPAGGQESDRTHAAAESGDYSDPSGGRGERDRDDYGRQATPLGRGGDVEMEEAGRNARERGAGQLEQVQGSSGEAVDGRAGGNAASEGPRGPGRPGNVPPRDIQAIIEKLVAFVKVRTYARGHWCGAVPAGEGRSRCGTGPRERVCRLVEQLQCVMVCAGAANMGGSVQFPCIGAWHTCLAVAFCFSLSLTSCRFSFPSAFWVAAFKKSACPLVRSFVSFRAGPSFFPFF